MKFVTVTIGGITQSVPESDVSLYLRAGYSVVDEKPAPITPEPVAPVQPPADPEPEPEKGKGKKSDK
jgi:hypothetical protein